MKKIKVLTVKILKTTRVKETTIVVKLKNNIMIE